MIEKKNLKPIGGWLIVVGIGIVVAPIRTIILTIKTYPAIFSTGTWKLLTIHGSKLYNPLLASILIGETVINIGLVLLALYLAYKFFTKSKNFPKWFIGTAIFALVFVVADAFAVKLALPNTQQFPPAVMHEVMSAGFRVAVWIPYMLLSERVKETFVL